MCACVRVHVQVFAQNIFVQLRAATAPVQLKPAEVAMLQLFGLSLTPMSYSVLPALTSAEATEKVQITFLHLESMAHSKAISNH